MGRKLDSATVNKTNEYNRTRDMRQQGDPLNDPDDVERGFNARTTLDTLRNVAEWFGVGARPPQGDPVRQRRDRLRHLRHDSRPNGSNHQSASMVLDATRDAIGAATRANVAIYGIDPRGLTDLGDESIELGVVPRRHVARRRPGLAAERAAPVAGQPAHAVRGDRRLRRRQQERFHDRLRAHRRGQQLVLRAGLLPARRAARADPQDRRPRHAARA